MGRIILEDMEFFAYHGCYEAEQVVGNRFLVNLTIETDFSKAAETDRLEDALNYHKAYLVVKEEMKKRSNLLENLAKRTIDAIFENFPEAVKANIKVTKLNPPIGGLMKGVSVEYSK
jgi:dihydroneopterin aldolase